jgi:putative endonuclease
VTAISALLRFCIRIPLSPPPFALRASGGRPDSVQGEGCLPKLMWYVYFLELKNGDVYVGSTNDLRRRVHSRQSGHVASTSSNLPVVLHSYVDVADETTSRQLERYFKSGSSKAFAKKRFLAWLLTRGSCRALYDRRGPRAFVRVRAAAHGDRCRRERRRPQRFRQVRRR